MHRPLFPPPSACAPKKQFHRGSRGAFVIRNIRLIKLAHHVYIHQAVPVHRDLARAEIRAQFAADLTFLHQLVQETEIPLALILVREPRWRLARSRKRARERQTHQLPVRPDKSEERIQNGGKLLVQSFMRRRGLAQHSEALLVRAVDQRLNSPALHLK